jgi:hypothetical protein
MLDKYLAASPTITEKVSHPRPPKDTAEVAGNKANTAEESLEKWQASWEKKG